MLYDYICDSCKKEKEVEHKMTDTPDIFCECGSIMRRRISKPHVHFKGGGFTKSSLN